MRRKPITDETKVLVAQSIFRAMSDERSLGTIPQDQWISVKQLCDSVEQCGIDPHSLAVACAITINERWTDGRALIDEIDSALCISVGENYSFQFLQHLCEYHETFRAKR